MISPIIAIVIIVNAKRIFPVIFLLYGAKESREGDR